MTSTEVSSPEKERKAQVETNLAQALNRATLGAILPEMMPTDAQSQKPKLDQLVTALIQESDPAATLVNLIKTNGLSIELLTLLLQQSNNPEVASQELNPIKAIKEKLLSVKPKIESQPEKASVSNIHQTPTLFPKMAPAGMFSA